MLQAIFILRDDDFDDPIYADPSPEEVNPSLWHEIAETVNDALDGDQKTEGTIEHDDYRFGWKVYLKTGLSFVAVVDAEVGTNLIEKYLANLSRRYIDDLDDIRHPEPEDVEDVVVDVIPPWED